MFGFVKRLFQPKTTHTHESYKDYLRRWGNDDSLYVVDDGVSDEEAMKKLHIEPCPQCNKAPWECECYEEEQPLCRDCEKFPVARAGLCSMCDEWYRQMYGEDGGDEVGCYEEDYSDAICEDCGNHFNHCQCDEPYAELELEPLEGEN